MADLITIGFGVETQGLKKGEKALDDFARKGEQTEARMGKTAKGVNKNLGKMSRGAGQAGIQFQQLIGQIQGGQGVMLALSQQAADLGIVLGAPLVGAIAGISASIGGMLLPSLFKTTDAMQELEKVNKALAESMVLTGDEAGNLSEELTKLAGKNRELAKLQISSAIIEADKKIKIATDGIADSIDSAFGMGMEGRLDSFTGSIRAAAAQTDKSFSEMVDSLGKVGTMGDLPRFVNEIRGTVGRLVDTFDITKKQAASLGIVLSDFVNEQTPINIKRLQNELVLLNEATGGSNEKLIKFSSSIIPLTLAMSEGVDQANSLRMAYGDIGTSLENSNVQQKEFREASDEVFEGLRGQVIALREGAEAGMLYNIQQRLNLKTSEEIPKNIRDEIKELARLKQARLDEIKLIKDKKKVEKDDKKRLRDMERLTDRVENFGGAWSRTGNVIIDTFGDMSDAMNDFMKQTEDLDKLQDDINEKRKDENNDVGQLNKLQMKLNDDRVSAQLSGMKNVADASAKLFKEDSKAQKAALALSKVITVAEIAMSFQKMAAKTTETAVVETNNVAQQSSNGLTAITAAFAAPFPVGFVAGAAMIGIIASLLGGSFGGGTSFDPTEQRQETQGTGTLLGSDEKSQSILNAQDRFEDIQIDQLDELRGIRSSLNAVVGGVALVSRNIVAGGGVEFGGDLINKRGGGFLGETLTKLTDPLDFLGIGNAIIGGLLGSKKQKVIDSGIQFLSQTLGDVLEGGVFEAVKFFDIETTKKKLFGLSKKVSTSTKTEEIGGSFGQDVASIFQSIGDTILQSAEVLGLETVTRISQVAVGVVDQSSVFDGMGVDFHDYFSVPPGMEDQARHAFKQSFAPITQFVTEEVEVSLADAMKDIQIDLGEVSLEGLSGEEIQEELEAVFSQQADIIAGTLIPGLEDFQQIGEGLFDTLTRVTFEQAVFNDTIKQLGFDLSELSKMMQIDVAQSIIGLTGGFESFSDLTSSFFDKFFSEAEKFEILETSLTEAFQAIGEELPTTTAAFRNLIEELDLTTEADQAQFAALLELNPALAQYIDALEEQAEAAKDGTKVTKEMADELRTAFGDMETAVRLAKQSARARIDMAREAHDAEIDRISELRSNLNAENDIRTENVAQAEDALRKSFDAEISGIEQTAIERSNAVRALADEEINQAKSISETRINGLNDEKTALKATTESIKKNIGDVNGTIKTMTSLINKIRGSIGATASSDLSGALQAARGGDFGLAQKLDVNALAKLNPAGFASSEEFRIQQAVNLNRLDSIANLAEEELTDSEKQLASMNSQLDQLKMQSAMIDTQVKQERENSTEQIATINSTTAEQIEAINEAAEVDKAALMEQLNGILGIDTSVLSIGEAITQFQAAQSMLDELNYNESIARLDMLVEGSDEVFELHQQAYDEEIARLDDMLESNEAILNATLGVDTSVLDLSNAVIQFNESIKKATTQQQRDFVFKPQPKPSFEDVPPGFVASGEESTVSEKEKEDIKNRNDMQDLMMREMVKNTKATAKILQRFDYDGITTRPESGGAP